MLRSLLLLILLPSAAGAAGAAPENPFLATVRAKIASIQPFSVEFVQQVSIDGEMEMEETGLITFLDDRHLKWEYRRPEKKVFLLQDERFQFYIPENHQLLRGRISRGQKQLIWHALLSPEGGERVVCDPARRTITIRDPGSPDPLDIEITLGNDLLPERALQKDVSGLESRFLFRRYRPRIAIAPRTFDLAVPSDTEIIDDFEDS